MHDKQKENQAAKLEQLFLEVSNTELPQQEADETELKDFIEVDVLQLPPRSEVHQKGKMSLYLSFRSPIMRLMLVIIFLIAIGLVLYGFYGQEIIDFFIV